MRSLRHGNMRLQARPGARASNDRGLREHTHRRWIRGCRVAGDPDEGSAVVEFSTLGLVLLLPIVAFVGVLSMVQAASFAAVSCTQQAAQAVAQMPPDEMNLALAQRAGALPAAAHGIDPGNVAISIACDDGSCTTPGATARVSTTATVALPSIPYLGGFDVAHMSHSTVVTVGRYA